MARLPRLSIAGQVHLLIQRVHQGQSVFAEVVDRVDYLRCLREAAAKHGVLVHGYGLAPSEVRLLATPADARALGEMVQTIGRRFVAGFNRRHGRSGSLWEGRYRAAVIEPVEFFLPCLRYVEGGGFGTKPPDPADTEPAWSSAPHHLGKTRDPIVSEHPQFWSLGNTPFEREAAYLRALQSPLPPDLAEGIALASLHGWVLGSDAFVQSLAAQAGRRLRPLPPGRPSASARSANTD
jgi:putative transposase